MNEICQIVQKYGPLAARILLAQLFIISGIGKIGSFAGTAAFMTGAGLPLASVLLTLTIALEVGGGILLVLGWRTCWIATAFFGFTFLTAVIFHPFWNSDPASVFSQLNNFMKNLAIMGGMLYVMAYGAGPLSIGADRCATGEPRADAGAKARKSKTSQHH